jgi:hypothetical protein
MNPENLIEMPTPDPLPEGLSPREILLGAPVHPTTLLETYSPEEYEHFVREWADHLRPEYRAIFRASGSGDMGRDVIAYLGLDLSTAEYDNYQCKHYDHPLFPSDIWLELGKLCWNVFNGHFRRPRRYVFGAPQGVGPTVLRLLEAPGNLRANLIEEWDGKCRDSISAEGPIPLEGEFRVFIEEFDFRIVSGLDPDEMIEQHARTRWHAARFGGGLRRSRPAPSRPPEEVHPRETVYVRKLLEAYGDYLGTSLGAAAELSSTPELARHFKRQREWFYRAASLREFERDNLPQSTGFDSLLDQIFDGVIDVCEEVHDSGFHRVRAVTTAAGNLAITSYVLVDYLQTADRKGACHHLANDERLSWIIQDQG